MGISGTKSASTPMEMNLRLTTVEYNTLLQSTNDPLLDDIHSYQQLVGKLIYLTITRLDICFVVQVLSQFMQCPKRSHWESAMRMLRYLKKTPGQGVLLKRSNINNLTVFCDVDWASCLNTRRSVTGYVVQLGDSLISWKSKKHHLVNEELLLNIKA
ncbi:uncharacterized mitochondrial protein AtMg00240-like [Lycium ferocissimum]|uniref:uncharacterized mitochondrial protein AtMg00240-like n=1 Tax=Lycium ferocissimum TaxID=112874 RepID=UPI002814B5DF|nr:uncharacterized mitochondrial protein AtMg00240-like [Lycium ferocissimum]